MLPGMLLNLCQIANSLTEQCGHETFQISGFWADYGQTAPYCLLLRPESPYGPPSAGVPLHSNRGLAALILQHCP